jgi:hypothetical protein
MAQGRQEARASQQFRCGGERLLRRSVGGAGNDTERGRDTDRLERYGERSRGVPYRHCLDL